METSITMNMIMSVFGVVITSTTVLGIIHKLFIKPNKDKEDLEALIESERQIRELKDMLNDYHAGISEIRVAIQTLGDEVSSINKTVVLTAKAVREMGKEMEYPGDFRNKAQEAIEALEEHLINK